MLWVGKGGGKSWFFVKSSDGARHRFKFGTYPEMSLAEARGKANTLAGKLAAGGLPKKQPKKESAAGLRSVDDVAKAFIEDYKRDHKSWRDVELDLGKHVLPLLGKRRADKIKRTDIGDVLLELIEGPRLHNKLLSHLHVMFKWAARRGVIDANPVTGFETLKTSSRDRVLSDAELRQLWWACEKVGYPYGPYCQLLMLLGQRRTETAAMERALVGHNSGLWEIPAERTKNGLTHLVPVPPTALQILAGLPVLLNANKEPSRFLFPASSKLVNHMTTYSEGKELLDEASGLSGWWFHDLRRTMSTGMASLGVPIVVTEAVLNHISGQKSGVAATYNRYQYLRERTEALEAWAEHLMQIVQPPPG
jgi:integrase